MGFSYFIGLLALAGLVIPVLIHLWNVKQGKTLKIGSIAFLGEDATSSAKSLKITDWLLFILRCLIITLIAMALAQPFIKKTITKSNGLGWILVHEDQFNQVYKANKPTIDSLMNLGFELHDFNLGFNQFFLKDSLVDTQKPSGLNYVSLLNQLNKQIPAGYTAFLLADHQLKNFRGEMPKLSFNLTWKEFNGEDTLKTWSASFLNKSYEAKSTPSFTSYYAGSLQDLPVIKVSIFDPTGVDSKYIRASLNAISDFTKRKFEVKSWNSSLTNSDVIFWLSELPFTSTLKAEANLFTYQKGKVIKLNSTVQLNQVSNQKIELYQRVAFGNLKGEAIWVDGFGLPLLIKKKEAKVNHFYFYTRFNPAWGDLVWSEQFTKAIMPLVLGNESIGNFGFENNPLDQRVLDKQQWVREISNKIPSSTIVSHQNLDRIIWVLALIVLLIERILSFSKKTAHAKN